MKNQAAMTIVPLIGIILAGITGTEAARESMYVEEDGVNFQVVRYDDDRSKPFRLIFTADNVRSVYNFNTAGSATNVKVGSEKYKVILSRGQAGLCSVANQARCKSNLELLYCAVYGY